MFEVVLIVFTAMLISVLVVLCYIRSDIKNTLQQHKKESGSISFYRCYNNNLESIELEMKKLYKRVSIMFAVLTVLVVLGFMAEFM